MEGAFKAGAHADPSSLLEVRPMPAWIKKIEESKKKGAKKESSAKPSVKNEDRWAVDHNNRRRSWKTPQQLQSEEEARERVMRNSQPADARSYPFQARRARRRPVSLALSLARCPSPRRSRRRSDSADARAQIRPTGVTEDSPVADFAKTVGTRKRFLPPALPPVALDELEASGAASAFGDEPPPLALPADGAAFDATGAPSTLGGGGDGATLETAGSFLRLDESRLPVELFDSLEFEEKDKALEAWVAAASTGQVPFFTNGEWRWRQATVTGYDAQRSLFEVKMGNKEKKLRRLNIMFDKEDPALWKRRREHAFGAMARAKQQLRFDYFIAKQPVEEVRARPRSTLAPRSCPGATQL